VDQKNEGHSGSVRSLAISDYGRIASGSRDNTIKVWDSEFNLIKTLNGHSDTV
jgi:WD40 repeat protein